MIRVRAGERRITVSGHAGHAPAGQDIVCAAVSALMYALAGYLEETEQAARSDICRGYADIEGAGDCGAAFTLVRCGMEQLAAAYPDCVEMTGS